MESQPQNPEIRNNPENFHPCTCLMSDYAMLYCNCFTISNTSPLKKGLNKQGTQIRLILKKQSDQSLPGLLF